jgi:hypothetical protein
MDNDNDEHNKEIDKYLLFLIEKIVSNMALQKIAQYDKYWDGFE